MVMAKKITLDADFDSGSLNVAQCYVERDRVFLKGRENHNAGYWKWIYFRARGVEGRSLIFEIDDYFEPGSERLDQHHMVYSYDQREWDFFPHNRHDSGRRRFEFGLTRAFEQDVVYIAYGLPYPFERMQEYVRSIEDNPLVHPTITSGEGLVIGKSPGGIDEGGETVQPHDLYGFRITDGTSEADKIRIVVMGGVHPNEPLGNHTIEGLIDFILSPSDVQARELRRKAEFFIYPMVNPDGRYAGYNRSTVQHVDRDANRFWREDLYVDMDDIRQVAEAIRLDTEGRINYFIDFHCWTHTIHHFGILSRSQGFHRSPFWLALRELEPGLAEADSAWENWSSETFAFKRLGADFAMTFETMFIPNENIDRFKRMGKNVGRALAHAIIEGAPTVPHR